MQRHDTAVLPSEADESLAAVQRMDTRAFQQRPEIIPFRFFQILHDIPILIHQTQYGGVQIIDLYDRRVVASVNGNRINTQLAIDTLEEAIQNVGGETGMILHSDRGSQFASKEFIEFCKGLGIIQSMSKPGCPYDNAPMERYFNTLKAELLHLNKYETEKELYTAITAYAYGWYNNLRPHSYNGGLPPLKVA